jgi:hypothetical protein
MAELASTVRGAMIITGGVMLAGTAATPLTAGGSGVLVAIGYAGTTGQCVNGLYRWLKTVAEMLHGSIRKNGTSPPPHHWM